MDRANYKVSFGKIARTVIYEDGAGSIRFTFDVETSQGKNIVILERTPKVPSDDPLRNGLAFERTKESLSSLGYQVEVFPAE